MTGTSAIEQKLKTAEDLIVCLQKDIHSARQERNDLLRALVRYGQHGEYCHDPDDPNSECYCGLEDAIAKAARGGNT